MSQDDKLFSLICQIKCGNETGNGFQMTDDYIITAYHVIKEIKNGAGITVQFDGDEEVKECTLLEDTTDSDNPLAILKLCTPRKITPPFLGTTSLSDGVPVKVFGFPPNADRFSPRASKIELKCTRNLESVQNKFEKYNVEFKPVEERKQLFNGYSGSPVILNGNIIGILLQQNQTNHVADRLLGLCGLRFRSCIKDFGIPFDVQEYKEKENITEQVPVTIAAIQPKEYYEIEIDHMVSELFEPFYKKLVEGELQCADKEFQEFINKLDERQCSPEKKAECYYNIACCLLSNGEDVEAAKLYTKAKSYNSALDERIYQAILLLGDSRIDEAKRILQPIDNISILNTYLKCMVEEHRKIDEVRTAVEILTYTPTSQTYRLLSICALNSDDFELSREYLNRARNGCEDSPEIALLDVLIDYWMALKIFYPNTDRRNFVFVPGSPAYLSNEQKEHLERAYGKLEKIYSTPNYSENSCLLGRCAWMLMAVSSILPGKDTEYWLEKFRDIYNVHPLDILFCIEDNVVIPKENIDSFLAENKYKEYDDLYSFAKLKLLVSLGEFDEAWRFFDANEESISKGASQPIFVCRLELAIDSEKYEEAKKLLAEIDLEEEVRTRFDLAIQSKRIKKTYNPFVEKAISFAKKTGKDIDFHNAARVCRKYKKWKGAEKNAKEWWKQTEHLEALAFLAESYYEREDYIKCLRIIDRFEKISDLPNSMKNFKINSLIANAEYPKAIDFANTFIDGDKNPKLVVAKSEIYKNEGKYELSLRVLQNFADKGLFDLEVYQRLIEQLQGKNPDLAFSYAEALYQHSPEDKNVIALAGLTSMMTGHSNPIISERYGRLLSSEAQKGKYIKTLDINQVVELMQKNNERNQRIEESYWKVEIPVHLIASNSLGGIIWNIIHNSYLPYYGKTYSENNIIVGFDTPLLIDYTTLLLLSHLEILETVANTFSQIWMSCDIFRILSKDITDLRNVQYVEIEKNERRCASLDTIRYIPLKFEEDIQHVKDENPYDHMMVLGSRTYGGYIIQNEPHGVLHKQKVSEEWYQKQIKPENLYAVLKKYGITCPQFLDDKIDESACELLMPHTRIILDAEVLYELCDAGAIQSASELFDIVIPQFVIDRIHSEVKSNRNRVEAADWLEKCSKTASALYEAGRIKLVPVTKRKYSDDNMYCQLLLDEIQISEENEINAVFDDRYINSMTKICGKKHESPIISAYDLIIKLYSNNIINDPTLFALIDKLLAMGYSHVIIPENYVMSRLQIAQVNAEGVIVETVPLKNIRKSIAMAFHKKFGLREEISKNGKLPERFSYFLNSHRLFSGIISSIWKSNNLLDWCIAASNWCLYFLSDWIPDIKNSSNTNFNMSQMLGLKVAFLVMEAFGLASSPNFEQYMNWMKQYVFAAYKSNPGISREIANVLNQFFLDLDIRAIKDERMKYVRERIISKIIIELPTKIIKIILESNDWLLYDVVTAARLRSNTEEENRFTSSPICTFETNAFIGGDYTQLENVVMYLIQNPSSNMAYLKEIITEDIISKVKPEDNQKVAQGLAIISQYAVVDDIAYLQGLKRKLSMDL